MTKVLLVAGVLAFSASGLVMAQEVSVSANDIIAARQGGMALTGWIAETMKAGVQSGADVRPFADGAAAMAKWATAYPALFPDGTQSGHETKAKPEIWSDKAGFEKADTAYAAAAGKLEEAAKSGDKEMFADAFTATSKTCGACHRSFKAR